MNNVQSLSFNMNQSTLPNFFEDFKFLLSRMNVKIFSVFTFCIPLISHESLVISRLLIKQVDFRFCFFGLKVDFRIALQ